MVDDEFLPNVDRSRTGPLQTSTYFGDDARYLFNQRCQTMSRKSKTESVRPLSNKGTNPLRESFRHLEYDSKSGDEIACRASSRQSDRIGRATTSHSLSPLRSTQRSLGLRKSGVLSTTSCDTTLRPLSCTSLHSAKSSKTARCSTAEAGRQLEDHNCLPHKILQPISLKCKSATSFASPPKNSAPSDSVSFKSKLKSEPQSEQTLPGLLSLKKKVPRHMNSILLSYLKANGNSTDESCGRYVQRERGSNVDSDSDNTSMISNDSDTNIEDDLLCLSDQIELNSLDTNEYEAPLTPRTRFISTCIKEGLNPRANMVRYKKTYKALKT